jgi:RHS repeat-associated protein
VIEDYTFDTMDRMNLMAHRRASDNAVLASYDYTYRADGKRTGLNESFSTTTARSNSYTWSYDNAGRLISEVLDSSDNSVDQTESYVYDLVGNRMRKEVNKPATAYVDQVFAYNYDANDRITSETLDNGVNGEGVDQTTTYGWTQTQQTSKTVSVPSVSSVVQSMSYGLGGQLEQVVTTTSNGSGTVTGRTRVDYRYTPQGIRTISVDWTDANLDGTFAAGERTGSVEYLIDNANFTGYQQTILEVTKNAAGQATKRITYTFGVDEITQTVSIIDPSSQLITQSSTLTFAHDGKGSVRALFAAAAAIAQVFTYSAYGELLAIYNGSGTLQPLSSSLTSVLYNGEGFDTRTGLYNMRARWYSASNARWERLDPFNGNPNDPFSFNKYGFVHGDPVGMTDPTGMFGLGGFSVSFSIGGMFAGMRNGAVLGGALGGVIGFADGFSNEGSIEEALQGFRSGVFYGAIFGAVTGGVGGGIAVSGASTLLKLRVLKGMLALNLAATGIGAYTSKSITQGIFRSSLGLLGFALTLNSMKQLATALVAERANDRVAQAKALARALDLDEGHSYRGHSYRRHGAHVTQDEHEWRIRTGMTPDGEYSPTTSSSGFASDQKQLEAYEAALTKLWSNPMNAKGTRLVKEFDDVIDVPGAGKSYSLSGGSTGVLSSQAVNRVKFVFRLDSSGQDYYLYTMYPTP